MILTTENYDGKKVSSVISVFRPGVYENTSFQLVFGHDPDVELAFSLEPLDKSKGAALCVVDLTGFLMNEGYDEDEDDDGYMMGGDSDEDEEDEDGDGEDDDEDGEDDEEEDD